MTDDLVVHLKFDESSGTTASNSGSGSDKANIFDDYGDPNEEPIGAEGLIGKSIHINGLESETYSFGILADYPKITDEGTVSLWLNTPGIDGESAVVVRNGSAVNIETENQFQITIATNVDGDQVLGCAISAGPNVVNIVDTEALALDEWVHVALTVDGGQLRLYKNAKLIGVTDYLDRINGSSEDWIAIGANAIVVEEEGEEPYFVMDEANPLSFSGSLDDLAIWHVARSADEIKAIYNKGVEGDDVSKAAVTIPDFVEPGEIVEPGGDAPAISVVNNGDGTVTVTFEGTLQSAPTVNGPWSDVDGASPLTIPADQAAQFGRAKN